MIDARTHHDPAKAPGLIAQAISVAGSQKELAARLGITTRYLRAVAKGEYEISYTLQVSLESLIID
jgi:DNA-binding transcriptional regulator YdaS (Cro superfamily)